MKRFTAILIAAVLCVCFVSAALADGGNETAKECPFRYEAQAKRISGVYPSDGFVETWVNGAMAGSEKLAYNTSGDGTYVITVYVNGRLADTFEIVVSAEAGENTDPGQSEAPDDPGQSETPDDPGQSETPDDPGQSEMPDDPGQSETPDDPGQQEQGRPDDRNGDGLVNTPDAAVMLGEHDAFAASQLLKTVVGF